jgi:HEAT repeat protein
MKLYRTRFEIRAIVTFVGLCALLCGAVRYSQDTRPSSLYVDWLRNADESRRLQAAGELGTLGADAAFAVPPLARAMRNDTSAPIRKQSAQSLASVTSKLNDGPTTAAVVKAFVRALKDNDPSVREAAAEGIGQLDADPEAAVAALLEAASDANEWVRGAAVAALGLIQKKAAVDRADVRRAIVTAMNDPSAHVREMGIYAYWATAEKSRELSIVLLKDDDVRSRRSVVTALRRNSPLAALVAPELIAALTDQDAAVRAGSARALGGIYPPREPTVPALTRALSDPDDIVRDAAAKALREIDDATIPPDPVIPGGKP